MLARRADRGHLFVRRLSVLTLTFAVALMFATACSSDSDNPTTAASSPAISTATAPSSTLVETTVEETAPPRDPGAPQDTDASPVAPENVDVCAAATADALMEALKSSPGFYSRVASPPTSGASSARRRSHWQRPQGRCKGPESCSAGTVPAGRFSTWGRRSIAPSTASPLTTHWRAASSDDCGRPLRCSSESR